MVPTPSGTPFTQALARELSDARRTCCSPAAATRASTSAWSTTPAPGCGCEEVSIGDYVLNGGEVAALAIVEAVARLVPGFMGNAGVPGGGVPRGRAARVPRLHQAGPLARPRRPGGAAVGRPRGDRPVAARAVAAADRRPAPRPAAAVVRARRVRGAAARGRPTPASCFTLQLACWVQEAQDNPGVRVPALHESLADVRGLAGAGHRARGASGGAAGGRGARLAARRRLARRPAHGRPRPPGPGARAAGCWPASRRRPRRASRRTSSSPGPGACATSGCTSGRATGCAGRSSRAWSG